MTVDHTLDIKTRIFKAAVSLFAAGSYGSVGVREIAREADVSISMISYHFGGKSGILKAIFREQAAIFNDIIANSFSSDDNFETSVRRFVKEYVAQIRNNRDLMMVWISELNNDISEVQDLKKEQLRNQKSSVNGILHSIGMDMDRDVKLLNIIGPAVIQIIFSHFVLGVLLDNDNPEIYDDRYYERYAELSADMILNGLNGLINRLNM